MLALRLDQPVPVAGLDAAGLERVEGLGLARREGDRVVLTDRGRFLGDAVTAALLS
jgi:coproporphyrinogen III oxidase-like Fe-S oxidoreductase